MDQTQFKMEADGDANLALKRVLRVCKRGRWVIAFASFVVALLTTAALAFVPSKYRSAASILIVEQEISPNLVAPLSTGTVAQRLEAMEEEVLSEPRLLDIIAKFHLFTDRKDLAPDAAADLMRSAINIEAIDPKLDQFSAFSISFTAETPQLAHDITSTLVSLFIERNQQKQATRAKVTTDFIQEQVGDKRRRLEAIEQRMQSFKSQYAGELPEDRNANEDRLHDARSQLETMDASLNRAKGQRAIWETALAGDLNARLSRLKTEKANLLKNYTPQHPEVMNKDEQIAQFEAALQGAKSGIPLPPSLVASADSSIAQLQGQLAANTLEIESLTNEEKRQNAKIEEYERRLNATPSREQELSSMTREADELNADVSDVLKKSQETGLALDVEKRQEGGQFRQLDPPSMPNRPSSPLRLRISLGGAVAGALLGLVLAFVVDLRNPSFHSEDELRERFSPPLLLSIPALLTPQEQRAHAWKIGIEAFAGSVLTVAIVAVEFYSYTHP